MMSLIALWHSYAPLVESLGGGGLLGWYGRVASVKAAERRDKLQAGDQALQLNAALAAREQKLTEELEKISRAHWSLLAQVEELYVEAIAARLIVHELDVAAGMDMRKFKPLPPYPFPAQSDGFAAGATAAGTAEPRAENTHV
ncbi:hypothetical protein [Acetobacter cibinongensis]|uniref:Uncharacterized protein n=1 Tax=Acetobacter cibinongensis TaxID=146475 RepID=A0A1Z5YR70_9PROT|nr:hypothetical protein [Acetobacter cibinongensis]OUI98338.1 hypothetical protein HK14_15670 [Acetobacter cibinongensis]